MNEPTIFHIWYDGERAAGLSGDSVKVEMYLPELEKAEMQYVKFTLAEMFGKIWDWPEKYIHVQTQKEQDAEMTQIEAAEEEEFWRHVNEYE